MKKHPNFLILTSTSRNAGKTTMACNIIKDFSVRYSVIGLKISPHFHELHPKDKVICKTENYVIVEETRKNTNKDSSQMLKAGAAKVYYMQVWDDHLSEALAELDHWIKPTDLVVCESGWIRNNVEPGVFLILSRPGDEDRKDIIKQYGSLADEWIKFNGRDFNFTPDRLEVTYGSWSLTEF